MGNERVTQTEKAEMKVVTSTIQTSSLKSCDDKEHQPLSHATDEKFQQSKWEQDTGDEQEQTMIQNQVLSYSEKD